MALNASGYTASGAGTASANTSYPPGSRTDSNGNPFFRSAAGGGLYFYNGGSGGAPYAAWSITDVLSANGTPTGTLLYRSAPGATAGTFPLTGWTTNNGASPAPTFTASAAAPYSDASAVRLAAAASGASVVSLADLSAARAGSLSTSADRILVPGQYADTSAARLAARSTGAASLLLADAAPARLGGRSPAQIALLLSDASRARTGGEVAGRDALSLSVSGSVAVAAWQLAAASLFIPSVLNVYDTTAGDPFTALRLFRRNWAFLKGPLVIPPQRLLPILDAEGASVRTSDFQLAANTLVGIPLLITGGDGVTSTVYGSGDEAFILDMGPVTDGQIASASPMLRLGAFFGQWMTKLNNHLAKMGAGILVGSPPAPAFLNLDQYATYQNGLTRYSFLVSPNIALLQWLYNNQQGPLLMQPGNVYAPATALGTATVGAGAGAVAFAAGGVIPTVNTPASGQQGYTPARGAAANVTASVNGTLTVTLTASGWDANGNPVTGRNWTAVLGNMAAGQSVSLTPAVTGDRISQVTAASGAGTATAGAFSLMSLTER